MGFPRSPGRLFEGTMAAPLVAARALVCTTSFPSTRTIASSPALGQRVPRQALCSSLTGLRTVAGSSRRALRDHAQGHAAARRSRCASPGSHLGTPSGEGISRHVSLSQRGRHTPALRTSPHHASQPPRYATGAASSFHLCPSNRRRHRHDSFVRTTWCIIASSSLTHPRSLALSPNSPR